MLSHSIHHSRKIILGIAVASHFTIRLNILFSSCTKFKWNNKVRRQRLFRKRAEEANKTRVYRVEFLKKIIIMRHKIIFSLDAVYVLIKLSFHISLALSLSVSIYYYTLIFMLCVILLSHFCLCVYVLSHGTNQRIQNCD